MPTLIRDVRYGIRMMLGHPASTAVAVLTLALGIGANTAIFSVVSAVILRPLPYDHPERLVRMQSLDAKRGEISSSLSFPNFADFRAQDNLFESMVAYREIGAALTGGELPERLDGLDASGDLFKVLGARAQIGQTFTRDDEQKRAPVVVLSHSLWRRRFGSDPRVIGQPITLNGKQKTIIGVMPASFMFVFDTESLDFFTPLDPQGPLEVQRGAWFFQALGKLKPGVDISQAETELKGIASQLERQYTDSNASTSASLASAHEDLIGSLRGSLLILLGAVGFVLLIACANVANLQLARAAGRSREMAIRVALGASRSRIIRQLLSESLMLSLLGGALGLMLATWGIDLISTFVPNDIPRFTETGIDAAVLGFTLCASVATGVVFGLVPALQSSRVALNEALKEGGRSASEGRGRHRMRSFLVVSEVALSLVLLVGAGLLIKSFVLLRSTNPGFNPQRVLTASVTLPDARYPNDQQLASFYQKVTERLAQLPGVEAAGAILPLPFGESSISTSFTAEGQPDPGPGARPIAGARIVTPSYLRALGIPLISGRDFNERDTAAAPKVLLVNESLARRFFPGRNPLGMHLDLGLNGIHGEIVGVVGDARSRSLEKDPGFEYYVPYQQVSVNTMSLVIRSKLNQPATLAQSLREVVSETDKDLPLYEVRPMESLLAGSVARQRFSMTLLAAFAGFALALAAAGVFSVMSSLVAQRTHEIGIRMALGAQPFDVLKHVVGEGMILTSFGVALGLAAAFGLTRLITKLLYGVSATDPFTYSAIALLLIGVTLLACYLPARRAMKVDPMVALRYE